MLNKSYGKGRTHSLMGDYSLNLSQALLRKRIYAAELQARLEAEIANKVKSEFIANMSHELRTPLNTVMGFSKMMAEHQKRKIKDQDISEFGELIHDAASNLLTIINDILDISKLQSGRFALDHREINLEEILNASINPLRQTMEEDGIELVRRIRPDLPPLRGDAQKLKQVFSNVIANAFKFSNRGGTIVVDAYKTADGGALVIVRDSGVGMTGEELNVALTPFGQVDGSRSRWKEGAGLGLPIAKSLVELHGGNLFISSAKNVGTEVQITLPSVEFLTVIEREATAAVASVVI
jgi:two-component system cell cycle sensor histidine kinase PleC